MLFYALGFAVLEAPFSTAADRGAEQQRETQTALAALPADSYPHVAATVEHLYTPDLDGRFDYGLRLLWTGYDRAPPPLRRLWRPPHGMTGLTMAAHDVIAFRRTPSKWRRVEEDGA